MYFFRDVLMHLFKTAFAHGLFDLTIKNNYHGVWI